MAYSEYLFPNWWNIWEGLGEVALLEKMCHLRTGSDISKDLSHSQSPPLSLPLICVSRCKLLADPAACLCLVIMDANPLKPQAQIKCGIL